MNAVEDEARPALRYIGIAIMLAGAFVFGWIARASIIPPPEKKLVQGTSTSYERGRLGEGPKVDCGPIEVETVCRWSVPPKLMKCCPVTDGVEPSP